MPHDVALKVLMVNVMKGLTQDKINLKNRNKIDGSGVLDKIRESDDTQGRIRKCHYRD